MITEFDEATHTAKINGRVVPTVTQAIKECGLYFGEEYFTEWYSTLGKYIHKTFELYLKGELDEQELDPLLCGYLESLKKLLASIRMKRAILIEERLWDEQLQTSGELDALIEAGDSKLWLFDWKRAVHQPIAHPVQTGGLKLLLSKSEWMKGLSTRIIYRAAVYPKADGSMPSVKCHDQHEDIPRFMAVLTVAQLKRRYAA